MCSTCGCNYPNYDHEGLKVPMKPSNGNPLPKPKMPSVPAMPRTTGSTTGGVKKK